MKKTNLALLALGAIALASSGTASAYTSYSTTFTDPVGLTFGTYMGGGEGYGSSAITSYGYDLSCKPGLGSCQAKNADARDWFWTQDGSGPFNLPSTGLIYDLGGAANKVVVFPIIDHGPLGPESWEYNVYLSNDLITWTAATLVAAYTEGWTADPAIADGYTTVWELGPSMTARYASITAGNNGNPDSSFYYASYDNEIDAVAGLTEKGTAVPEPGTLLLLGAGLLGLARGRKAFKA